MTTEIKSKILKVMELALILNPMTTQRKETGNKPTVFVNFYGHTASLLAELHSNGWDFKSPHCIADKRWDIYCDVQSEQYINAQIDEIITTLENLVKRWCEDE